MIKVLAFVIRVNARDTRKEWATLGPMVSGHSHLHHYHWHHSRRKGKQRFAHCRRLALPFIIW